MYIYITRAGIDLIPPRQLARVRVPLAGRHLKRARDDRAAAFERRARRLQLPRLQIELDLQVLDAGRPGDREMVEQAVPVGSCGAHPLDLRAADRIEQRRDRLADEQVLAAVNGDDEVAAFRKLAEPRPLRARPLAEAASAGLVCLLVTRLVEAGQRRVRRAR